MSGLCVGLFRDRSAIAIAPTKSDLVVSPFPESIMTKLKSLIAVTVACLLLGNNLANSAPIFVTTGQLVTGITTNITLTAGSITPNNNLVALSNSGSNLVVTYKSPGAILGAGDFHMTWNGAPDGLNFSTTTYKYLQIDIASVSPGMIPSNWELFWQDDDSTVGGGTNSSTNLGSVDADQTAPFSLVIDLVNGTSNGATGWGPGLLDIFRIDPFQSSTNQGESFTISAITFGSELTPIPEPSSVALIGLGVAGFFGLRLRCKSRTKVV